MDRDQGREIKDQVGGKSYAQDSATSSWWTELLSEVLNKNPLRTFQEIPVKDSDSPELKFNETLRNVNLQEHTHRDYKMC